MQTKQLKISFASGPAYLFVADGCGEIRVTGFAPLAEVAALRARLGIKPQHLGAWDCHDGSAAIDYRVPASSFEPVTVRDIVKRLGRRWSNRMLATGGPGDYATV